MADSGAIRAGRAFVELGTEDSKLGRGLLAAKAKLQAWGAGISSMGTKFMALGAAVTAPLAGAAAAYTSAGTELGKFSQRTGIAVEELSALSYAARRSGVDADQLGTGIKKMERALFDAGHGGGEVRQSLHELGLSLAELKDLSPDQQLKRMADAFHEVGAGGKSAALAQKLFGKSGTDMLPFLLRGKAGIEALEDKGRRLGNVLGGRDVAVARAFAVVMGDLKDMLLGVTYAIGQAVIPGMTRMRNLVFPLVEKLTAFARANAGLFDVLFDVATGVTAAGLALVVLGKTVSLVGGGLGVLWAVVKLGAGIFAAVFSAVLSPIGLTLAAVGALTAAFLYLTNTGAQVRASLMGTFSGMAHVFRQAWGGIVDAIKAGDLSLAFGIAVAGVKVIWQGLIVTLRKTWIDLVIGFKSIFYEVFKDLLLGAIALNNQLGLMSDKEVNAQGRSVIEQEAEMQRQLEANRVRQKGEVDVAGLNDARAELGRLNQEAARKLQQKNFANAKALDIVMGKGAGLGDVGAGVGTTSAAGFLAQSGGGVKEQLEKANEKLQKNNDLMQKLLGRANGGLQFG